MSPRSVQKRAWRVFYTRPNAERRAAERLAAQGMEKFVPVRAVEKMWSDRKKWIEEPLFRGYLFAHVQERERLAILEDEGVVRCLRFDGQFAELSDDELATLRRLVEMPECLEASLMTRFPVGQSVTVKEGPLVGLRGRVIQHRRAPTLIVELHSIRQAVRIHVRADWLQPRAQTA
jgi:transcriptional antiterminator RfaH